VSWRRRSTRCRIGRCSWIALVPALALKFALLALTVELRRIERHRR
jgi:hypothetical protein